MIPSGEFNLAQKFYSSNYTNIIKDNITVSLQESKVIKELIKLANHLDSKGFVKEADYLDRVIQKNAESMAGKMTAHSQKAIEDMGLERMKSSLSNMIAAVPQYWDISSDPFAKPKCKHPDCEKVDAMTAKGIIEDIPKFRALLQDVEGPSQGGHMEANQSGLTWPIWRMRELLGRKLGGVVGGPDPFSQQ